jgi:hypothetical protein
MQTPPPRTRVIARSGSSMLRLIGRAGWRSAQPGQISQGAGKQTRQEEIGVALMDEPPKLSPHELARRQDHHRRAVGIQFYTQRIEA